ncbi:uncharacterized protein LOC126610017 [Malus sylvestris]|uniref:uncharacterized protein LOC126610017 n=1 Tax=Malus sylvestris TaxID=3752 RepID=UPI0021ABED76|nr:uncharacterized protein LOC126610017 [Malus sylvestris]
MKEKTCAGYQCRRDFLNQALFISSPTCASFSRNRSGSLRLRGCVVKESPMGDLLCLLMLDREVAQIPPSTRTFNPSFALACNITKRVLPGVPKLWSSWIRPLSLAQLSGVLTCLARSLLGVLQYEFIVSLNGTFVGPLLGLESHNQSSRGI